MSELARYAQDFRNGNTPGQYLAVRALDRRLDFISAKLGLDPNELQFLDDAASPAPTAPPSPAAFNVQGLDGKFIITVTNPQDILALSTAIASAQATIGGNAANTPIYHEIQSALDLNFNNASGTTDYGVGLQLAYEFQDPNVTKFWRLRSSFDGQNWNAWQIFQSALTCGPVGVWSGLMRTAGITQVNSSNTPSGGMTQVGTSTVISVPTTTFTFGSGPVTYSAGTVDPGSLGTWYVYCIDPMRTGGVVTFLATANSSDLTTNDGVIYFGVITTSGGGGGTGGGGGNGPCCVAEVLSDLYDGTKLQQSELRKGMVLKGIDGGPEPIERIEIIPNVPCFSFTGANGLVLRGCSGKHALQYDGGGFDDAVLILPGHRVETVLGATKVTRKFIGHRTVYKLCLGGATKTFIADGWYSHNARK